MQIANRLDQISFSGINKMVGEAGARHLQLSYDNSKQNLQATDQRMAAADDSRLIPSITKIKGKADETGRYLSHPCPRRFWKRGRLTSRASTL